MIAYLHGTVVRATDRAVVLSVQGVGYLVYVPAQFLAELMVGDVATIHVHTTVTESDIVLYGFQTAEECSFFEQLIGVSGIGSKTALQILSQPVGMVQQALVTEDIGTLVKVPGIGRKTAERLIVELKDKVQPVMAGTRIHGTPVMNTEALDALVSLGFPRHEAIKMLARVPSDISSPAEVVQFALKQH